MEQLWQKLFDAKIYTKSLEDFKQQFSTEEKQQLLHEKLSGAKYYSKSFEDFKWQFFAGKPIDPVKEAANAGSKDQAANGGSDLVNGSLESRKNRAKEILTPLFGYTFDEKQQKYVKAGLRTDMFNTEEESGVETLRNMFSGSGLEFEESNFAPKTSYYPSTVIFDARNTFDAINAFDAVKVSIPGVDESIKLQFDTNDKIEQLENIRRLDEYIVKHSDKLSVPKTEDWIITKYNTVIKNNPDLKQVEENANQKYLAKNNEGVYVNDPFAVQKRIKKVAYSYDGMSRVANEVEFLEEEFTPYQKELKEAYTNIKVNNQDISDEEANNRARDIVRNYLYKKEITDKEYALTENAISEGLIKQSEVYAAAAFIKDEQAVKYNESVKKTQTVEQSLKELNVVVGLINKPSLTNEENEIIGAWATQNGLTLDPNASDVVLTDGSVINENLFKVLNKAYTVNQTNQLLYKDAIKNQQAAADNIKDLNLSMEASAKNYDLAEKYMANVGLGFADIIAGITYLAGAGVTLLMDEDTEKAWAKSGAEYSMMSQDFRNRYVRDVAFEDAFSSASNFGKFTAQEISNQLPILVTMAASGGTAAPWVIGASSAGSKMMDMQAEIAMTLAENPDAESPYSKLEIWAKSIGYGTTEAIIEKFTTIPILKGAKAKWVNVGKDQFFTGNIKEFIKSYSKKDLIYDPLLESGGEALTTGIQNLIDGNSFGENIDHAAFSGFGMGLLFSTAPFLKGIYNTQFAGSAKLKEAQTLKSEINQLSKELSTIPEGDEARIQELTKLIEDKSLQLADAVTAHERLINNNLTERGAKYILDINSRMMDLQNQAKEIAGSDKSKKRKDKEILVLKRKYDKLAVIKEYAVSTDAFTKNEVEFRAFKAQDEAKYNEYIDEANRQLLDERDGKEAANGDIERRAYNLYFADQIRVENKKAKGEKGIFKGREFQSFETVTDAEAYIDSRTNISEEIKNTLKDGLRKGNDGVTVRGKRLTIAVVENQVKNQRKYTRTHEVGHQALWNILSDKKNNKALYGIANQILTTMRKVDKQLYNTFIKDGIVDTDGNFDPDEVFARFLEYVSERKIGTVQKAKGFAGLFGTMVQKEFSDEYSFNFNGEHDMYNFAVTLGRKIKDGTLTIAELKEVKSKAEFKKAISKIEGESVKKLAKEGAKGNIVDAEPVLTSDEEIKFSAKSNLDEQLNKKYKGNPKRLIAGMLTFPLNKSEFAQQIGGITNTITKRLYDPIPADQKRVVSREDFIDALISEAATMVDQEYKGLQNLDKFVSTRLNLRANNLASRLGIESSIKADVTEQKGIMAEETAEQTVDIAEKEEVQEKRKVKSFIKALNLDAKVNNTTLGEMLNSALAKNVALGIRQYDAEISANRTVTPFIQYIKNELAEDLHKDIAKTIDQYPGGYEAFLSDYRTTLLYNYTTTYLSKNPLFKKGILKSVGGKMGKDNLGNPMFEPNWVVPRDISKLAGVKKYDWVDENGKKLKIDRDNAGQRGLTSGPIIMKRNPNIDKLITEDEFINFHFDDGSARKKIKANARLAIARQIASEAGLEIMKDDFQNEGPLFQSFKERADLLGTALAENAAVEIAKDIDRGVVKFSKTTMNEDVFSHLQKGVVTVGGLVDNKTAAEIWDNAITKGPNSKKFKDYLKSLDIDKSVLDRFLDVIINDYIYLFERAQKAKANNLGDGFEIALNELLRRQFKGNFSVRRIKQIKGDLGITIGSYAFAIEVKLNDQAQIGSTTIRNIFTDPKLYKDIELSSKIIKKINEKKSEFNNFIEHAKKYGAEIDPYGALKLKDKADWETIKKTWGKTVPRISFEMDQQAAMQLYKTRAGVLDVLFIHIGGKGTYSTEITEISAGIPVLQADMEYVVRMVRSGDRVSFRLFPNFKTIKNESPANLENSEGIKRFIDIITKNIANKYKDDVNKALANSSVKTSKRKGISVWDFDDTLATTKSNVLYTMPDGTTGKLNAEEFAKRGDDLLAAGAKYDFSEFSKVMKGKKGPMFEKAIARNEKFGNEHVYILTARPADSKFAIHEFLKGVGLDIKLENIIGLANSAPQAKADWIIGKVAEGYNDFYFADDAYKNVAAVQDVLSIADVKSDVQQVKVQFSERLNEEFNEIIEDRFGIESYKRFSEVVGRRRGYKKGKWRFFIPPSAEDFQGLLYDMYGKGKRGELQKEWFDQALILPYIQGVAKLEKAKQKIKRTYANFLKENKGVGKKLRKKIEDGDFTYDQALRVYLWTQAGYEIPGLSQRDQNKLNAIVQNDEQLINLSIQLRTLSQQEEGWIKPEEYWDGQTLLSDLSKLTEGVSRQAYLGEFIENVDIIFSKENKNKLRAALGNQWVDAAENAIQRMKSGVNHVGGADAITNRWTKWVNNSVGSIMFFNRRSATLQLLSTINFLNWSDNNPLKAAQAFANQPQYWKDWSMIFNSDKLKERRGGLKTDVSESEIANAAEGSKNKVSAIISYLLKIGFTPTQIADSIAIASGGATFYRNRANSYMKQGMTNTEAEAKAFEDFSRLSDEAQQSSDPLLISQEQSTTIGRLVLAFANTPQQYMRLTKKAARDLINGRGDAKTNISKILYYTFVQNLIFSTLQAAGFALIPGFDDDDEELEDAKLKEEKTTAMVLNSMSDTVLRGLGLYGAIASTIKNVIMKYTEEKEKTPFKQDMDKVVYAALNISPPIGSKAAKIKSALNTEIFDKDIMEARGYNLMLDGKFIPNPRYSMIGKVASASLNLPMDRAYDEISSITEMLDSRNTAWQRIALGMGYKTWQVGADIEEHDLIKITAKAHRKEEGKVKAKTTIAKNKIKKREAEIEKLKNMTFEEMVQYEKEQDRKAKEKE